jgi:hypothetical protein
MYEVKDADASPCPGKQMAERRGFKADGGGSDEKRQYLSRLRNRCIYKGSLPIGNRNTVSPETLVQEATKYVSSCPWIRTTSRVAISGSMSIALRRYTSCGPLDLHKHFPRPCSESGNTMLFEEDAAIAFDGYGAYGHNIQTRNPFLSIANGHQD